MKSKNLEVKAARNGLGVFAMKKIPSGKTIYKVEGKDITTLPYYKSAALF